MADMLARFSLLTMPCLPFYYFTGTNAIQLLQLFTSLVWIKDQMNTDNRKRNLKKREKKTFAWIVTALNTIGSVQSGVDD